MTVPQQGSPAWDVEADERDALASLDDLEVTRVADTLPREDPLMSVDPLDVPVSTPPMMQDVSIPPQATSSIRDEKTVLRRKRTRRRVENDDGRTLLRRRQATSPRPAVPSRPYDEDAVPVPKTPVASGFPAGADVLMLLVIFALRLAAIGMCGLVIVAAVPALGYRVSLMPTLDLVTSLLPPQIAGLMVIPTPFGGAWRGDLVGAALALFVVEWLLTRLRLRLKRG